MTAVPAFREELAPPEQLPLRLRFWRPPWRVAAAAWTGVATVVLVAFGLDLDRWPAWLAAIAAAALVWGWPLPRWRRAPLAVELDDDALRLRQGRRALEVPLATLRDAYVLPADERPRRPHGVGLWFGPGGRPVWDVPAAGARTVRLERGGPTLDLDVASARPEELVAAIHDALASRARKLTP